MSFIKNVALNLYSSMKFFLEEFECFCTFSPLCESSVGQISKNISKEWSRVKNLSSVSCAAWNIFPVNLLMSSIKDRDPTNYIRLSNFPKDKRLENPSLSLIVGRILLLCIASIKKWRQCAQNWTFDNAGNTYIYLCYRVSSRRNQKIIWKHQGWRNRDCQGGVSLAPPIFGRSVDPIPTRGSRLCPPQYY